MTTKQCNRHLPHGEHEWASGGRSRVLNLCPGISKPSTGPMFTMGTDATAGQTVTIDPRSGLLVPINQHLMYGLAEEYAWSLYETATALATASGVTFAEAATNCVEISDGLNRMLK